MANVSFKVGTLAAYNKLPSKDQNTLYFISDTLQIFKGDKEYSKSVQLVTALPQAGVQGVLYVNTTTFALHAWNGSAFVALNKTYATSITSGANDTNVPTTKAVKDYVTAKVAEVTGGKGIFVTDVTYTPATGTLGVAKGEAPVNTVLTGVVNNPEYDPETRKITLPVFGGDALEINLGKDLVVKSGSYVAESKSIELVLTSEDKVTIPVGSLVDIYTGVATSSATVTVNGSKQISVAVKVSATANNQITLEDDGLYVPLPDAYTKAQIDEKIETINSTITAHTGNADIHVTKAQKTAWDAKATTAQVATAKQEAITAAAADAKTKADKALADAKSYASGLNTAMDTRMRAVEASVTWGTLA